MGREVRCGHLVQQLPKGETGSKELLAILAAANIWILKNVSHLLTAGPSFPGGPEFPGLPGRPCGIISQPLECVLLDPVLELLTCILSPIKAWVCGSEIPQSAVFLKTSARQVKDSPWHQQDQAHHCDQHLQGVHEVHQHQWRHGHRAYPKRGGEDSELVPGLVSSHPSVVSNTLGQLTTGPALPSPPGIPRPPGAPWWRNIGYRGGSSDPRNWTVTLVLTLAPRRPAGPLAPGSPPGPLFPSSP